MRSPAPGEVKWGVNVDLFIYSISAHQCIIPTVYLQFAQNLEPLERLLSFAAETFQIIVFLPNFPVEVVSFCFLCTVRTVSGVSGLVQPAPSVSCPAPDKTRQTSWRESVPVWGRLWRWWPIVDIDWNLLTVWLTESWSGGPLHRDCPICCLSHRTHLSPVTTQTPAWEHRHRPVLARSIVITCAVCSTPCVHRIRQDYLQRVLCPACQISS